MSLIDIGCGYGTFLFPFSELISGIAIGLDIDSEMVNVCHKKIQANHIKNVRVFQGDISEIHIRDLFLDYEGEVDYVTLFNILHCEEPMVLLRKVFNVLRDNGRIGVVHWKKEDTPRGPSMDIRPTPAQIIEWALKVGFTLEEQIDLPPYHYGLVFNKN